MHIRKPQKSFRFYVKSIQKVIKAKGGHIASPVEQSSDYKLKIFVKMMF